MKKLILSILFAFIFTFTSKAYASITLIPSGPFYSVPHTVVVTCLNLASYFSVFDHGGDRVSGTFSCDGANSFTLTNLFPYHFVECYPGTLIDSTCDHSYLSDELLDSGFVSHLILSPGAEQFSVIHAEFSDFIPRILIPTILTLTMLGLFIRMMRNPER